MSNAALELKHEPDLALAAIPALVLDLKRKFAIDPVPLLGQ